MCIIARGTTVTEADGSGGTSPLFSFLSWRYAGTVMLEAQKLLWALLAGRGQASLHLECLSPESSV